MHICREIDGFQRHHHVSERAYGRLAGIVKDDIKLDEIKLRQYNSTIL